MTPLDPNNPIVSEGKVKPAIYAKISLILLITVLVSFTYLLYQNWPTLITTGIQWQKQINNELSELLHAAKNESLTAGISLIVLSFLYGILHSVGPGHGKLIVTTYIATQDAKVKLSLTITLVSSLMQAFVAVALVSVLLLAFNASMREINHAAEIFIPLSFYTAILLGIAVICRNLLLMYRVIKKHKQATIDSNKLMIKAVKQIDAKHEHHDNCGCGHQHVVAPEQINDASSFKEYLAIILSIGIRPCTGAIMVLLFANMLDIYWLGIVSAIVMALGTALTTSLIAIMTITGKQAVRRYLAAGKPKKVETDRPNLAKFILPIFGGALLILLGVLLLESRPVGMSPMF